jgi:hypothetical protein
VTVHLEVTVHLVPPFAGCVRCADTTIDGRDHSVVIRTDDGLIILAGCGWRMLCGTASEFPTVAPDPPCGFTCANTGALGRRPLRSNVLLPARLVRDPSVEVGGGSNAACGLRRIHPHIQACGSVRNHRRVERARTSFGPLRPRSNRMPRFRDVERSATQAVT